VPKGPPLKTGERRLAIQVEDHPVEYIDFKGTIPPGQYGAGTVSIWDQGSYDPVNIGEDSLEFIMHGAKLRGRYALVRLTTTPKNWLLLKMREKG
jgi:bifunctional non-homologous end joining protein LigD